MIRNIKQYDITNEHYVELIYSQRNKCKICEKSANGKTLSIDHSHVTGKVRGLLCNNCNTAIGLFKEDINVMLNAIKYLQEYGI